MNESEKKIDAKLIFSIIAAGIMSFSGVVVETAMNVTFPTLMEEFGIGTSTVQWITTGYLLILAMIIPASSYLKKRFTLKKLFVTAICLFLIGTIMAAVTPVFSLLLLGRLIQGVGTGIALPLMFQYRTGTGSCRKTGTDDGNCLPDHSHGSCCRTFRWRYVSKQFRMENDLISLIPLLLALLFPGSFFYPSGNRNRKNFFPVAGLHISGCRLRLLYLCHQYSLRRRMDQRPGTGTSGSQHYLYRDILSEM